MSNSSKYYETLPNNFPDDLADSLMAAFNIESVDSKEEMPKFLDTLYQKGYQITVRPDLTLIDVKYFIHVERLGLIKNSLQSSLLYKLTGYFNKFNHRPVSNIKVFIDYIKELNDTNNKEYFSYPAENIEVQTIESGSDKDDIIIRIGEFIVISCRIIHQ